MGRAGQSSEPDLADAMRHVDSTHFRRVLGHFASGIAVITAVDEDGPAGLSCQSFTSVSLDPPLVSFAPSKRSRSWPRIRRVGRFCANVLAADQERICRAFASSGGDKFSGVSWQLSAHGSPVIEGALSWVDCTIEVEYDAGDHVIVLGRVHDLDVGRDAPPLLFFRGGYGRFSA
ncbi:MAG: flavin reductase family protein [Mycobacteriales bacterium]